MPPRALSLLALAGLLLARGAAAANDPHLDPALLPAGCVACHEGHGVSGSPMLASPQKEACLACHDTQAKLDDQVRAGKVAPSARPHLMGSALAQAYAHPLSVTAFSRHDADAVVCSSCHSPHRRSARLLGPPAAGTKKPSTRNPTAFEHELCESCHGNQGPNTQRLDDISRLLDPSSRSFHPVHEPAQERSPSVLPQLAGKFVNCSDCHANSDRQGARGPHASMVSNVLGANFVDFDGSPESPTTYALCYECHDRTRVLEGSLFRLHSLHVVSSRASCATCHSAHGSVRNRALIRFGEETTLSGVSPSASTGRLEFNSDAPGQGNCYLTCHGVDHAPKAYGAEKPDPGKLFAPSFGTTAPPTTFPPIPEPPRAGREERLRQPPPPR